MFRQNYLDIEKPEYQSCCCGVHVRKLASILAIIFLALTIPSFFANRGVPQLINVIVAAVVYVFLLLADKQQKPEFYLPFLIYMGLCIIALPILYVAVAILLFTSPDTLGPTFNDHKNEKVLILIIVFVVCAIVEALYVFFWRVVYGARRYMIAEVKTGNVVANYVNQV
uniref:Lysosomal-associated transmembrane protein 4B n=1 Tax=Panagrolaimus sp. JU765 TaxID=591449 RepID=A0AC34QZ46_9BILA